MKKLVVLSGPNGSGISSAKYVFEEAGFYIVENPPVEAIPILLETFHSRRGRINKFALLLNIVTAKECMDLIKKNRQFDTKFILLMANKSELLKRYTLTRHAHVRSVMEGISIEKAIEKDILDADELSPEVDFALDTSNLSVKLLRQIIYDFLECQRKEHHITINFISFGLKNGMPSGLDMFFDVRSIPNPYWVDELKELTGYDKKVIDYMNVSPITRDLIGRIIVFLEKQLEDIVDIGRSNYNIGIACSGGQHRSTYVAKYLKDYFASSYETHVIHRDTPELNDID